MQRTRAALLVAALAQVPAPAGAADARLAGRVTNLNNQPLAYVAITLDRGKDVRGASFVTVFTDVEGRFRFPETGPTRPDANLAVRRPGYKPAAASLAPRDDRTSFDFALEPTANVAADAPASAWLAAMPDSEARHLTQLMCTQCHQFPTPKVRDYARLVEAVRAAETVPAEERESWRRLVRRESWRAVVKYMRAKSYEIFPDGTSIDIRKIPWETIQAHEYALFNGEDEEIIAAFLADHLPTQFDFLAHRSSSTPSVVDAATVVREYRLPDSSLVREVTVVPGSPFIWGADVQRNRLLRLDPKTGEQAWFPVPHEKATGPHTILGDDEGRIWVSMIESDLLGRFDPRTQQWKLWKLHENGKDVFGGQAVVHDVAFDHRERLARDAQGRIWLTLVGSNKMASLHPETGEVRHYDAPAVEGRAGLNITLYGTLLSADGRCAWFSQLNGFVGCFNTETLQAESLLRFSRGAGPRRMSIDEEDTLWIPLFGSGRLVKYDGRKRRELARYDLPDRGAAPYAVTWDAHRQVLWVATSNADVIYRFDPKTERFATLPLPRRKAFLRQIALHPVTHDLIVTYAHIPVGSGPSMVAWIEPGD